MKKYENPMLVKVVFEESILNNGSSEAKDDTGYFGNLINDDPLSLGN